MNGQTVDFDRTRVEFMISYIDEAEKERSENAAFNMARHCREFSYCFNWIQQKLNIEWIGNKAK